MRHIQIQVEIELTIISIIMKPKVGQQHIERIYVKVTKHSAVIIFKKVKLRDDVTKSTFLILLYFI